MPGLFDSCKQIKSQPKKHFVTIQDTQIEVTLQQKLEIIRVGESNYVLKDNKPFRKQIKSDRTRYAEITKFVSDPFWPKEEFIWKK